MTDKKPTGLELLRQPFPAHQISKLPKPVKSKDDDKGKCQRGTRYSADGYFCGGWHARSIHLDYVGHAALTDRLLDADPNWYWEPVAFGDDGLPQLDKLGGLWIRLTVCGVTRLGYGDAQGKTGPNAIKEAIGDGLRNAAMRFGAALDLWHKGDLHDDEPAAENVNGNTKEEPDPDWDAVAEAQQFEQLIDGATTAAELSDLAARISASAIQGPAREQLRQHFSAKVRTLETARTDA